MGNVVFPTDWETEPQTLNIIYSWPLTFPSAPAPVSPAQLSAGSVPPSAWWEGPGPERMPPWGDPDEAASPPPPLPPPSPQTSLSLPPSSLNEPKQDQQKVNNNMCKHKKQQTALFSFKNQGGNLNLQNVWDDLSTTLINMFSFFYSWICKTSHRGEIPYMVISGSKAPPTSILFMSGSQ